MTGVIRPTPSLVVSTGLSSHWLSRTRPEVKDNNWPYSNIDRFVLAGLESSNLEPSPDADRITLLRRAYFVLTGLPPTRQQAETFINDTQPDAYERLVDQLLASPQFGERWGRHWLDLARYADSNGMDENFLFREAWRYRNWVIDAVNKNIPLNRFLLEQIAGDLLPFESTEQRDQQRIAAGFMVVGPKVLLGNDPNERVMDVADEQLNTIGRAVLGQTLGCARCHDHKFDPIPTADYYAMTGILTSTSVLEQRYMLGQQRVMEQLIGLGDDGADLDNAYEKYWRERPALTKKQEQAKQALKLLTDNKLPAFDEFAKKHVDAVAEGAADSTRPREERIELQKKLSDSFDQAVANPPKIPPRAMTPIDRDKPTDEAIRVAGKFNDKGEVVPRGFLQVVSRTPVTLPADGSGRVELAQWLTDTDNGAGHLAARVLANRIWYHVIGRGIVRTVDNFGRTGETPSNPELLDHLASQLIESGWSRKSLIRRLMLSRTFRMSSHHNDAAFAVDPENSLNWRANRRRLEPESLRDAMMLAAGTLDLKPMDSTVWYLGDQATAVGANTNRRRTDFPCRSVYLPVIRNDLPEIFDVFNFADPQAGTGMRPDTLIPTQGLFLLNEQFVYETARATATRVLEQTDSSDPMVIAAELRNLLFNDPGSHEDQELLVRFVDQFRELPIKEDDDTDLEVRAWTLASQALFASSQFQMVE